MTPSVSVSRLLPPARLAPAATAGALLGAVSRLLPPALLVAVATAGALFGAGSGACVPAGSAPPFDGGTATTASSFKPSLNVMTAPFEDNFERGDAGDWASAPGSASASASSAALLPEAGKPAQGSDAGEAGADLLFFDGSADAGPDPAAVGGADAGERRPTNLGPNWLPARTNAWRVENGQLCGEGARNHGVWLNRTLPVNVRIEFDAISYADDGDIKVEVFGDGHSFATGTSYTNATSYLVILGGWKNTLHVIARLNEHGGDRKTIAVDKDSDDPRQRPVVKSQLYQFKIERTDGKTLRWSVNGVEYLTWTDANPLAGQGHDHFGFNDWDAKVCFDNVKVTPL